MGRMQNKFVLEARIRHATIFSLSVQDPDDPDLRKPEDATLDVRVVVSGGDVQAYWRRDNELGEPVWSAFAGSYDKPECSGVRVDGVNVVAMVLRTMWEAMTPQRGTTPSGVPIHDLGTL